MRWLISIAVVATFIAFPVVCKAEAKCDPKDPKSCVQAVTEGEPVPFSGQLMTHRRAAKLVVTNEQCADERALDLEEAHEIHQIQVKALEQRRKNDFETCKLQIDLLNQRMMQMQEELAPPWYEHPAFVATVSVVLTVAVFAAAVKTVEALQ